MKKIKSILLSALLIIASLSGLTTVCQALDTDDTVYPGDQVIVTYSFNRDIPEGCKYYYFEANCSFGMVEYSGFKNHWALRPWIDDSAIEFYRTIPVTGIPADGSHYGPKVKKGEKIISIVYDVTKETKVSDFDFSFVKVELGINNQYKLLKDSSYLSYNITITSKDGKPVKPTTVAPTTTEPTTVAPTTEEPTTVEPTTAKLKTVKGTVKSYLSESDTVTIQLIKSGEVAYETTVKGNNAKYSISGVASGTYTMKV